MKDLKIKGERWQEIVFFILFIPLFLMLLSEKPRVVTEQERPGCFPDYRPGYGCMVFEKQPY
jgi:hypothetical protein